MALSVSIVWECRTTGSDTNGGGFHAGASGTDYSQQDAAQLAVTDADAAGTTNLHSATGGFTSAMVGNIVQISGGTLTAGFYEITAFVDTNNVTLDRSPGTGSGSTAKVGGCLATVQKLLGAMVGGNKGWVRSGDYTVSANITFAPGNVTTSGTVSYTDVFGYYQTRGDIVPGTNAANRPRLLSITNGLTSFLTLNSNGTRFANFQFDWTSPATTGWSKGIIGNGINVLVQNCRFTRGGMQAIQASTADWAVTYCEVTGMGGPNTGAAFAIELNGNSGIVYQCAVHDNTGLGGLRLTSSCHAVANVIGNNSGSNCDGINTVGVMAHVISNTIYGNGRDGIRKASAGRFGVEIVRNNIIAGNGGYGMNWNGSGALPAMWTTDGNFYYGNTSGARNNVDDTGSAVAVDASGPYTNTKDVTGSGDPFVNGAGSDFSLNATAGAGAAARSAGHPQTWPGLTFSLGNGKPDFGPWQAGGGTTGQTNPGIRKGGGIR
jgi:hypothetical protein